MSAIVVPAEGRPTSEPDLDLTTVDGNAFAIMGATAAALKASGASREFIQSYRVEAMSGDYNHLLQATIAYLET